MVIRAAQPDKPPKPGRGANRFSDHHGIIGGLCSIELGWIDVEQHAQFLREGAIGSHLENLQRREGFKGFNQQAVSAIIAATNPRSH